MFATQMEGRCYVRVSSTGKSLDRQLLQWGKEVIQMDSSVTLMKPSH